MERFEELLRKLGEDIAAMTDEELTEARVEVNAYGLELRTAETETDEDEAQLTEDAKALAAAIKTIDETLEARATAAAEAVAAREDAFASFEDDSSEEPTGDAAEEQPCRRLTD